MTRNDLISSWSGFLQALEARFAPSQYDDPKGIMFKLTQRGTINDYLSQFETLANHIIGLPPSFLLICFLSNLASNIRREVQALQPLTMVQASMLARLQEEELQDHCRSFRGRPLPPPSPSPQHSFLVPSPPTQPLLPTPLKPPSLPLKCLSPEEIVVRRKKGLCFNCDETFSRSHWYSSKFFILIADDEDGHPNEQQPMEPPFNLQDSLDPYTPISLHAS